MVFYLNSEENKNQNLTQERNNVDGIGYAGWQVSGNTAPVLLLKYNTCEGGSNTRLGTSFDSSLILSHINGGMDGGDFICTGSEVSDHYGVPNAIAFHHGNNTHFEIEVIGTLGPDYARNYELKDLFKEGDYITVGFYKGKNDRGLESLDSTELIFEDNTKYIFSETDVKTIETPKNLSVSYDNENYIYNFS
jgi:hypothetical protein